MQLVIDIGNTRSKIAVFKERELIETRTTQSDVLPVLDELIKKYPAIRLSMLSSVVADSAAAEQWLRSHTGFLLFTHQTPLPVRNLYESPETLGKDRLAAAIGAWALHKNSDLLIIDAGTALKTDLLTADACYRGGAIAPGLQMRFQALHQLTGRLPLIDSDKNYKSLTGKNTRESILNGVQNGMLYEIQGSIDAYISQYPALKIILTGGDAPFFEPHLKNRIFAIPGLTMTGLNEIVLFNAQV